MRRKRVRRRRRAIHWGDTIWAGQVMGTSGVNIQSVRRHHAPKVPVDERAQLDGP